MIDFCVVDTQGFVVQSGTVQEEAVDALDVPEGHQLHVGVKAPVSMTKVRILKDGKVVDTGEPKFVLGYELLRRREYPQIGDQLEAIWETLETLVTEKPEKAQQVLAQISEVKQRIPKEVLQPPIKDAPIKVR